MKRLLQNVQQIRAGGTSLWQTIGGVPGFPLHLPIPEPSQQRHIEGAKAAHLPFLHPSPTEHPAHCPPRHAVVAFLDVEATQPEGGPALFLQVDEVIQQLRHVHRASPRPETQRRLSQVALLQDRRPRLDNALTPNAVEQVQDGNGPLILRT